MILSDKKIIAAWKRLFNLLSLLPKDIIWHSLPAMSVSISSIEAIYSSGVKTLFNNKIVSIRFDNKFILSNQKI